MELTEQQRAALRLLHETGVLTTSEAYYIPATPETNGTLAQVVSAEGGLYRDAAGADITEVVEAVIAEYGAPEVTVAERWRPTLREWFKEWL